MSNHFLINSVFGAIFRFYFTNIDPTSFICFNFDKISTPIDLIIYRCTFWFEVYGEFSCSMILCSSHSEIFRSACRRRPRRHLFMCFVSSTCDTRIRLVPVNLILIEVQLLQCSFLININFFTNFCTCSPTDRIWLRCVTIVMKHVVSNTLSKS